MKYGCFIVVRPLRCCSRTNAICEVYANGCVVLKDKVHTIDSICTRFRNCMRILMKDWLRLIEVNVTNE